MSAIRLPEPPVSHPGGAGSPVLQSVNARGTVSGLLFELAVEQHYVNASETGIEAVYTFPVPWDAVLLGVEFVTGDRVLQGAVVARTDAERTYESAVENGNTAVMVKRTGSGMYTVSVGNLLPQEQAIVRFRYAQLLCFIQGRIRLTVPTTIAPRYGDPQSGGLQSHQVPATSLQAQYPFAFGVDVTGDLAGATFSSPSHGLSVRSAEGTVTISLGSGACLDRDFVLVAEGLAGRSLSTLGRDGEGYVALASFCPGASNASAAGPVNLKIPVDCSGSMNGERIDAARRALHEVLSHLEPGDSFSLSRFGSRVWHCSQSLMAATPRAIAKAGGWVAETLADMGGTELNDALLSTFALAQPFEAGVLLITDGDIWDTDRLVTTAEMAGQRVFAVGVGSAPASGLLHALASRTGGACELMASNTEVHGAIMRMFRRMRQAPSCDVSVAWEGKADWQTSPVRTVPDGETLHLYAGFGDAPPATATLGWYERPGGTRHDVKLAVTNTVSSGDILARMAASMRMESETPSARHTLALRYGLVSATTNLVLVHQRPEAQKPGAMPALRTVAHTLPAGWGGIGSRPVRDPMRQPAVWRREPASGDLAVMQRSAVETYDIPAFLRKRGSEAAETGSYLYRRSLRRFVDALDDRESRSGSGQALPASLDGLQGCLPDPVIAGLRLLVYAGLPEQEVIHAFVAALIRQCRPDGVAKRLRDILRRAGGTGVRPKSGLEQQVEALVTRVFNARQETTTVPDVPVFLRRVAD
jgi:Ca-activated chloride channel family protein